MSWFHIDGNTKIQCIKFKCQAVNIFSFLIIFGTGILYDIIICLKKWLSADSFLIKTGISHKSLINQAIRIFKHFFSSEGTSLPPIIILLSICLHFNDIDKNVSYKQVFQDTSSQNTCVQWSETIFFDIVKFQKVISNWNQIIFAKMFIVMNFILILRFANFGSNIKTFINALWLNVIKSSDLIMECRNKFKRAI